MKSFFLLTASVVFSLVTLSACEKLDPTYIDNKAKLEVKDYYTWSSTCVDENEIFQACIKNLPTGPQTTKYNDWDEVVAECRTSAYNIATRQVSGKSLSLECIDLSSNYITAEKYTRLTGKPYER